MYQTDADACCRGIHQEIDQPCTVASGLPFDLEFASAGFAADESET
jgi:hypothetical protein